MKLGEKIKLLRKNKKISQEELSNMLNINRNFLSRIETGKSEPTSSILKKIAVIFNVDLNSLLEVDEGQTKGEDKIKYILIGGGDQNRLKKIAKNCNLASDVIFTGAIEHSQIFELLDKVDIYIQPSLQEGLPRAMIEALSRGLPAIGFRTAGIPELISDKYICRRKSVSDICKCIMELDATEMKHLAIQNHNKSKEFLFEVLNKKREIFIREAINQQ